MILGNPIETKKIAKGALTFNLLDSGDIYSITKGPVQVNLLKGNNIEGANSNIYLRLTIEDTYYVTPLIGVTSLSQYQIKDNQVIYQGEFKKVKYQVILTVLDDVWFYEVLLDKCKDVQAEIFYGQDIGIADENAIKNNEAYTCQYIDHRAFKTDEGYTIASRQNQGVPHFLQQGSLTKNVAYSTDAFQFFKREYKESFYPEVLKDAYLDNENYQYEYAYTALQSEKVSLNAQQSFVFYGYYQDEIVEVADAPRAIDKIHALYETINSHTFKTIDGYRINPTIDMNQHVNGLDLDKKTVNTLYKTQRHQEVQDNKLLSFFTDNHAHVVLKQKELLVERPHGNIAISGGNRDYNKMTMASTHFMFGIFNSHIVLGNSNFHKMTSNLRSPLNTRKISGQRVFIKKDGVYKLLNLPSIFEVGANYSKWIYQFEDDQLIIESVTAYDKDEVNLEITSQNGKTYDLVVMNHLVMGANEDEWPVTIKHHDKTIQVFPHEHTMMKQNHNDFSYTIMSSEAFDLNDDSWFYSDKKTRNHPLLNMCYQGINTLKIKITGQVDNKIQSYEDPDLEQLKQDYFEKYQSRLHNFHLSIDNQHQKSVDKFNDLAYWYMHNALIHYASPHGLEQYSGAAWGTRDICQGPAEYFSVMQDFKSLRAIILKVYAHQFVHSGDWPQWFMFDEYHAIQAHESHGDIIVWPLRTLALYLEQTNDYGILEEKIPYMDINTNTFTDEGVSLKHHIEKQINTIIDNFIEGTSLSTYGGGDWDDTLQPANQALTKRLVSGWTVALTYETFDLFSKVLTDSYHLMKESFTKLKHNIKKDYNKYLIRNNVPTGFLLFEENDVRAIVHPEDKETNLRYRLLPFNRGIISEMFDQKQITDYLSIIDQYLKYPDGVRLMDNTVQYKGGINTYFQRAETAANFGREIGLQYVHAHIRYIEALAKLGNHDAWEQLMRINPILIDETVNNAMKRQSNTYFSSSDANFKNRYEAMQDFNKLKTGEIDVKGGWRIYSSGPGIYLNQLIGNVLGIRISNKDLVIDPVLPDELYGLKFHYTYLGKPLEVTYHIKSNKPINTVILNGEEVSFKRFKNAYKDTGIIIDHQLLNAIDETIFITISNN